MDRVAGEGDPLAFGFPRSLPGDGLDFSFSGLKTSLLYRVRGLGEAAAERRRADLAASYQRAIVDVLATRAQQALEETGIRRLAIGGGVAANSELRGRIERLDADIWIPDMSLFTDNAAMIAGVARVQPPLEDPRYLALDATPSVAALPPPAPDT